MVYFSLNYECYVTLDISVTEEDSIYTPLSDFEYDVLNGEITLEKYTGNNKLVNISPTYYVDGNPCQVIALNYTFTSASSNTIIVPEGVKSLSTHVFDSSATEKVYLPASLENVPDLFWECIHVEDTIYYGGTEEQFNNICSIDRFDIDVKHMVYEANPEDILEEQVE